MINKLFRNDQDLKDLEESFNNHKEDVKALLEQTSSNKEKCLLKVSEIPTIFPKLEELLA